MLQIMVQWAIISSDASVTLSAGLCTCNDHLINPRDPFIADKSMGIKMGSRIGGTEGLLVFLCSNFHDLKPVHVT